MSESVTSIPVAFAGGWSAGHVTPGLALAEAMREKDDRIRPVFFGAIEGLEADLVRGHGFEVIDVVAAPAVPPLGTQHRGPPLFVVPADDRPSGLCTLPRRG